MDIVIWFNGKKQAYELGTMSEFIAFKINQDTESEVLYEFNSYTKEVAKKVVSRLNDARLETIAA